MLLEKILQADLVDFKEGFATWQDAIKGGCEKLIEHDYITNEYVEAIIKCVSEFGPYIVIAPMIAMPHSTLGATGVNKTGIGLMITKKPVSFVENDPEKDARLFFTLAANSHDEHLENMMQLSEMLMNDDLVADLLQATNLDDIKTIIKKYQ